MRVVEVPDGEFSSVRRGGAHSGQVSRPREEGRTLADLARECAAHAAAQGESGVTRATFVTEQKTNRAGSGALPRCYRLAAPPA